VFYFRHMAVFARPRVERLADAKSERVAGWLVVQDYTQQRTIDFEAVLIIDEA
jgi:hypothetical protein